MFVRMADKISSSFLARRVLLQRCRERLVNKLVRMVVCTIYVNIMSQTRHISSNFPLSAGTEVVFQVRCRITFNPRSLNDWIFSAAIATSVLQQVQPSLSSRHSIFGILGNLRLVSRSSYNGAAVWYVVKRSPLLSRSHYYHDFYYSRLTRFMS